MKFWAMAILPMALVGCHASNPSPAPLHPYGVAPSEPDAGAPSAPFVKAPSAREGLTLRIAEDGSIRAADEVVYDPKLDNTAEFKAFLAAARAQDPLVPIDVLAARELSPETVERVSKLAGEDMQTRGPITFNIAGTIQTSYRFH